MFIMDPRLSQVIRSFGINNIKQLKPFMDKKVDELFNDGYKFFKLLFDTDRVLSVNNGINRMTNTHYSIIIINIEEPEYNKTREKIKELFIKLLNISNNQREIDIIEKDADFYYVMAHDMFMNGCETFLKKNMNNIIKNHQIKNLYISLHYDYKYIINIDYL